jgi:hypothetical protein
LKLSVAHFSERTWAARGALILAFASIEFFLRLPLLLGTEGLYQRDLLLLYFPLVQSVLRGLSEGALPLRDPSSAFGQPVLGDPSCQILYPPVALHLFLPPHQAYAWFVSLHSVFGAVGVALLARRFAGGSWLAALVGGLAWLVSGPLQSLATLWHHMAGAAWIPWVLLCVIRVVEGDRRRGSLILGAVLGLQILAGSADMCAMTILLSVLFIPPKAYLDSWRAWSVSAGIGLALSAGVWLPATESVLNSARSALTPATRTFWSLHPFSVIEFFLPFPLAAFPLLPEWRTALFEGREPFLGSMFLGAALLPLCLAALADGVVPRSVRFPCFLGLSGAVLIALGKHASAYSWATTILPPLRILRFPSKAMIGAAILICVLAGVGAAAIRRSPRSRRVASLAILTLAGSALFLMGSPLDRFAAFFLDARESFRMAEVWGNLPLDLLFSVGLLLLLAGCVRWPSGRLGALLAGLLVIGHLRQSFELHKNFNATVPAALLGYKPEHLPLMRPPGDSRLFVYDYALFQGRAMKHLGRESAAPVGLQALPPDSAALVAARSYLNPLVGAFWGIEYAWDADLRLLFDRRLASLTVGLRRVEGSPSFVKLLRISGVSRVAARHEKGFEDLTLLARQKIFDPDDLRIFEVPAPLPRAFLTTGRTRSTGSDLADLLGSSFDPSTTVLVDDGPTRKPVPGFVGQARIVNRIADRLTVETASNAPAFLSVIEGFMPGWRVWIDGQAAKLERANTIFVGTEVPAGAHRIDFRFLPTSAVAGVALTGSTALFLVLSLLVAGKAPEPD